MANKQQEIFLEAQIYQNQELGELIDYKLEILGPHNSLYLDATIQEEIRGLSVIKLRAKEVPTSN